MFWERWLGIATRGRYGEGDALSGEHRYYATIPYGSIFRILDSLSLRDSDVFVDLGSGKGRTVCCAATYNIRRVIGVEDVEALHRTAKQNAERMRGRRAPISLIHGRAQNVDFTMGSIFYLFNPFGPETLREVVAKLKEGIQTKPRDARIVYVNPVHEEVLAASNWLTQEAAWRLTRAGMVVSVWKAQ